MLTFEYSVVPFEKLPCWARSLLTRHDLERLPVQCVVVPTVLELFAYAPAYLNFVVERHSEIPEVEEVVKI